MKAFRFILICLFVTLVLSNDSAKNEKTELELQSSKRKSLKNDNKKHEEKSEKSKKPEKSEINKSNSEEMQNEQESFNEFPNIPILGHGFSNIFSMGSMGMGGSMGSFGFGSISGGNGFSKSSTRSYSYSNINGKESSKSDGMDLEATTIAKKGEKPHVQKYGKIFNQKNNGPLHLKEQASSTDETENLVVENPEEKDLKGKEAEEFLDNDPFFSRIKNLKSHKNKNKNVPILSEGAFPSFPSFEFNNQENMFHDFFERKTNKIMKNLKKK